MSDNLATADRMAADRLPSFRRPPVVETVLSVQFDELAKFRNAHLGAFWASLRDPWTVVEDAPPLLPQFERFGESSAWLQAGLRLRVSQELSGRIQIFDGRQRDRMIQVQNGRFVYNWLGRPGLEYPRYEAVRPEFDEYWAKCQEFLHGAALGQIKLNQWEVTYVNHIPQGTVWNQPSDWPGLFRGLVALSPQSAEASTALESFEGEWHFEIKPRRGRLHVQIKHGRKSASDPTEVLVVTLTARGPLDDGDLGTGLDLGHETIVRTFTELTSSDAHVYWGLETDGN